MPDALRLALGTFTRVPVPAPTRVDARTAGAAMVLATVVGAVLGAAVGAIVQLAGRLPGIGPQHVLMAALAVAALAYLTRALHLDGLADTADALGSGKPADAALTIARRSDIGPFGVVTLVLVLLVDVVAYAGVIDAGAAALGLAVAVGSSRLVLVIACVRGIPAARPDGLGATVAGTVPVTVAVATIVGWLIACTLVVGWLAPTLVVAALVSVIAALVVGAVVVTIAVRRLGGITGDVLGATIEVSLAAALVILVAVPH